MYHFSFIHLYFMCFGLNIPLLELKEEQSFQRIAFRFANFTFWDIVGSLMDVLILFIPLLLSANESFSSQLLEMSSRLIALFVSLLYRKCFEVSSEKSSHLSCKFIRNMFFIDNFNFIFIKMFWTVFLSFQRIMSFFFLGSGDKFFHLFLNR